jgi:TP901 family phage tail tape measure protein
MARANKLGRAVLDLDVDQSKFNRGLDTSRQRAKGWTDSLGRDVKRGLGQGLGIAAGLGVAGAVAAGIGMVKDVVAGSINAAMEYESAFAGVRKTVDASESEFEALSAEIREMATEMPIAATELAGLAEAAGALGIAKDDISEFTRVTALIGTTTDVASGDAATSLGQLSNVLHLTSQDYERFGSTLVDLGNKGASTESQILGIASRAGAGSALIGMATDETLAWSSAVANLGIEVEAGGSAIQKFFLDSARAVAEGTDKLETMAQVAGMSGAQFKRAFEDDASAALQTFLEGLGRLDQGSQLAVLSMLDFNDVRITRTMLGLAGNAEMLGDSLEVAGEAWQENNALQSEAEKRFGTTESQMQILGNRVNDLAISFGDNLLPGILNVATVGVEALENIVKAVDALVRDTGGLIDNFALDWGDAGDRIHDVADELANGDFQMVKDRVRDLMDEGLDFEDAADQVEEEFERMGDAVTELAEEHFEGDFDTAKQHVKDAMASMSISVEDAVRFINSGLSQIEWQENEADAEAAAAAFDTATYHAIHSSLEMPAGVAGAMTAGQGPVGTAADGLFGEISDAAAEAEKEAIDSAAAIIEGLKALFTQEELHTFVEEQSELLVDEFADSARAVENLAYLSGSQVREGLASSDSKIREDAAERYNTILGQYQLLPPAVRAEAERLNPELVAGLESNFELVSTTLRDMNGMSEAELAEMIPIWKEAGMDAVAAHAEGIVAKREAARLAAEQSRISVENALAGEAINAKARAGGQAIAQQWIDSMAAEIYNGKHRIEIAVGSVGRVLGYSLPTDGPLKGATSAHGGTSIGEQWIAALADSVTDGIPMLDAAAVRASLAMEAVPRIEASAGTDLADVGQRAAGVAGYGGSVTNIWQLNVEGEPVRVGEREDVLSAWETMTSFNDAGVRR